MSTIKTPADTKVVDPIVRIEAKAKGTREDEHLAVMTMLGKYSPNEIEQLPPNPEVLEALMFAQEVIHAAVSKYQALLLAYTMHEARKTRIPGYGDDNEVGTTTDKSTLPSTEEPKKDFGGN